MQGSFKIISLDLVMHIFYMYLGPIEYTLVKMKNLDPCWVTNVSTSTSETLASYDPVLG